MRIAFGTDEQTPLTESVVSRLGAMGHDVMVVARGADWPDVGRAVGEAVVREMLDAFLSTEDDESEKATVARVEPGW